MADPLDEAEVLYTRAQAQRSAGELRAAVTTLEELVARRPDYPNALNLLGWVFAFELEDLAQGIRMFRRAVEKFPLETVPMANLVEALVASGQPEEAHEVTVAARARKDYWREAWNLSGWVLAMKLGRVEEGIADLRRAVGMSSWYGDARLNLARALTVANDFDGAYEHFRVAASIGCFRTHEAFAALGQLDERKGWLRRAMGDYRQAVRLDARHEYTAALHEAINRVGNTLLRDQKFFLHADDEHRRARHIERQGYVLQDAPMKAADLIAEARKRPGDHALLIANLEAQALLPASSDKLLAADAPDLAELYFPVWMRLYEALLEIEEPTNEAQAKLFALGRARRWNEALFALREWDHSSEEGITFAAATAERFGDLAMLAGDERSAADLWGISEDAFAAWASGSSSGAEGLSRMVDVDRLRAKIRR
jgi:tetratricopeptide (TPR) repeat protein